MRYLILILILLLAGCSNSPRYNELHETIMETRTQYEAETGWQLSKLKEYAEHHNMRYAIHRYPELPQTKNKPDSICVSFAVMLRDNLHKKGIKANNVLVATEGEEWNHLMVYSNGYYMDNNNKWPVEKSDLAFYKFNEEVQ